MSSAKTFFSYSRSDESFALRLAQDLRQAGIPVWFDQLDIPAGRRWDTEIQKALGAADSLLVVLSPSSVASENVMDEVSYALDQNKHVIPVLHQPCDVPLRIRRLQYIDFTTNYESGLTHLLQVLRQIHSDSNSSSDTLSPPVTKTVSHHGGQPAVQSAATKPAVSVPKSLLYGIGAIVLAALIYFMIPKTKSPATDDVNVAGTTLDAEADTTATEEDTASSVVYDFDRTNAVKQLVKDSIHQIMKDYRDPDTNQPLPANLSYEITYENDCYQFYIKMAKETVLPDEWLKMMTNFGTQLNDKMFGETCLVVGAWNYVAENWEDSTQFSN